MRSLVDPRLARTLTETGHYPNRVTIERTAGTRNSVGQIIGTADELAGHIAIPARVERDRTVVADETRLPDRTAFIDRHAIALAGFYPEITTNDEAVDELGRRFNITAVDHDAAHAFTFLRAEVVG